MLRQSKGYLVTEIEWKHSITIHHDKHSTARLTLLILLEGGTLAALATSIPAE